VFWQAQLSSGSTLRVLQADIPAIVDRVEHGLYQVCSSQYLTTLSQSFHYLIGSIEDGKAETHSAWRDAWEILARN